ncbi:MAG: cupin [Rhodoplanes sp.]
MINPKLHDEFKAIDMTTGWETPTGYPEGIQQKILAGSLDETAKTGNRSRLLRFAPGVHTTKAFVHDYWEEVLLISGDLTVGNNERGEGGEAFTPLTFACRPPGVFHGPFKSKAGCLLFEIHYFA